MERLLNTTRPASYESLEVYSISINSPGWWEVIGQLNPLDTIRNYLNDRHERIKDSQYRNQAERERLRLENERLRNQVFKEKIEILRELGFSNEQILRFLSQNALEPLEQLGKHQDTGLIGQASLTRPERNR